MNKTIILSLVALTAFAGLLFMPQAFAPSGDNISGNSVLMEESEESGQKFQNQEDLQASLLSVNAGGALLPFILILGPGAAGFLVYMNRQRKKDR